MNHPTVCHYCRRRDETGESLVRLIVDVGLSMRSGRRTFTIDYCRNVRACEQDAFTYAAAIGGGEVEEQLPPRGGAAPEP
jgi:hypothetical protein